MNVYSVVKVLGEIFFAPQVVDHGKGQKLSLGENFLKFFSCDPPSDIHQRMSENKKRPSYHIG